MKLCLSSESRPRNSVLTILLNVLKKIHAGEELKSCLMDHTYLEEVKVFMGFETMANEISKKKLLWYG